MGATDADLADLFEVNITTIWRWKAAEPEFCNTINNVEKKFADNRVRRSLYQRAVGYSYDAVKIFHGLAGVVEVPYREHVPPDVAAGFIWLKNRCPEEWRDRRDGQDAGTGKESVVRVEGALPGEFDDGT